jgi:hypothetical protein
MMRIVSTVAIMVRSRGAETQSRTAAAPGGSGAGHEANVKGGKSFSTEFVRVLTGILVGIRVAIRFDDEGELAE